MAFPTYPYGYQPYYPPPVPDQLAQLRQNQMPPQMMQQPAPQQMTPQPVQQISGVATQNSGINWVQSKMEADNWPVLPGSAVALWDSNNPVIYLRQADSTGKPSTKVYDLVERTDVPTQQAATSIDLSKYITIEAAEEIIERRVNDILTERFKRTSKPAKQKEDTDNG